MTQRRIYVASSWRNPHQPEVVACLRVAGHEVYDFRNPKPGDTGFAWKQVDPDQRLYSDAVAYRKALQHPIAKAGFDSDHAAMEWADTFVMVQPCGRSAHLELGWACGRGKDCWVLLEDGTEPELMLLEVGKIDHLCTSLGELIERMEAEAAQQRDAHRMMGLSRRSDGEMEVESRTSSGRRLRWLRLRARKTLGDLARFLDTTASEISGVETDRWTRTPEEDAEYNRQLRATRST